MQLTQEAKAKEIIEFVSQRNALIDSEAAKLLAESEDFKPLVEELLGEGKFILDKGAVENRLIQRKTKVDLKPSMEIKKAKFRPLAAEVEPSYRILDDLNVTGQSLSEGKVDDFLQLFHDRFSFLSSQLRKRNLDFKPINRLKNINKGREVAFIGMVCEKWTSKNGHLCLQIEDTEAKIIALILKDETRLMREAEKIILDDVIAIQGVKSQGDMIIIKGFFYPDISLGERKKAWRDLSVCVTSDTHIGSKLFLEKEFARFIDWLNLKVGDEKEKEKAGKIKYLFFVGDNVDGIGVYPEQFEELNITDIYEQYQVFSSYLEQVPEYIEMFICPGQHDAVRRADPQPAIAKEFLPELFKRKNFHSVSSPGWVEIEGLKVLMYHGASLHDLYASVGYLDAKKPEKAIIDVLKRRSLMISYGLNQPYVPEKKDFMLIRETPDLYFGGDMHHNGYGSYRNIIVINNGTWQSQTNFQVKLGHVPTPGIVPVLELKTGKITENYFHQAPKEE